MRIIAGTHRGRKLHTLPGGNTRPMMDRMKEAIFQIIGPYFDGELVLDLFGGSGALSFEALSRGAKYAYICDVEKDAVHIIQKNGEMLNEKANLQIVHTSYEKMLQLVANQKFDIVFLDPPYHMPINNEIITHLLKNNMLLENAYIICHFRKGKMKDVLELKVVKSKIYGDSEWCIYQFTKE